MEALHRTEVTIGAKTTFVSAVVFVYCLLLLLVTTNPHTFIFITRQTGIIFFESAKSEHPPVKSGYILRTNQ